ncbi:MAG TPA: hypothetical protein VKT32_16790, partial [Chthonomonadaceae bacterium]|nr:hypothetical protein [Chthonomonadaceae bacterium]
ERDNPDEGAQAPGRVTEPGALQTAVSLLVPASLGWGPAAEDPSGDGALPSGSAAADLVVWIGASAQNAVRGVEGDRLVCWVTTAGLSPERALAALGGGRLLGEDAAVSAPLPAAEDASAYAGDDGRSERVLHRDKDKAQDEEERYP